ncbi:hypothetical protein CMUS01_15457, partial [Colletotrichum musicola]
EATKKACAAYRKRNTGSKQWDTCPDCTVVRSSTLTLIALSSVSSTGVRHTTDPNYCAIACNSNAEHIGGDEWLYYCKQAGADGSEAY